MTYLLSFNQIEHLRKALTLFLFFVITSLCFSFYVKAENLIVFVDQTRNLDYFKDNQLHLIDDDLLHLTQQFHEQSPKRLILIRLQKVNKKKFIGSYQVLGRGLSLQGRFKTKEDLSNIYKEVVNDEIDFLFIGHTMSNKDFELILSQPGQRFGTIMSSACKTGNIETLKVFSKYTNRLLASPENVHLAHFELDNISQTLSGTPNERLFKMLEKSFARLKKFTKSNLVLNVYDLSNALLFNNLDCNGLDEVNQIVLATELELSSYENRSPTSNYFKLNNCKNE